MLSSQNINMDEKLNTVLYKMKKSIDEKVQIFHLLAKDISDYKNLFQNMEGKIEKK
jgi:hypothetical protein